MSAFSGNLVSFLQTPESGTYDLNIYRQRIAWWDSDELRSWFSARGYALYTWIYQEGAPTGDLYPAGVEPGESSFPFAYQGGEDYTDWNMAPPLSAYAGSRRKVVYAQDSLGRHVAIKVVKSCSNEHRILQYLRQQGLPTSMEDFQNVIPILDLLQYGDYCFAVMPRWGDDPDRPLPQSIREIFNFIHGLLKGLKFLHKHKIVHGDIQTENILVNHFGRQSNDHTNQLREDLRFQGCLTYAFFDFDCSTIFPQSYTLAQCRQPYQKSRRTFTFQVPSDTSHGEPDFDPFAFDVGMLGVMFCHQFQHLTPKAPMLAPFFDRMTTRNLHKRFTAAEALDFFEEQVYPQSTKNQLAATPFQSDPRSFRVFDVYDRWKDLDQSFVVKWAAFQEPPVPLRARILRSICAHEWGYRVVACIRRLVPLLNRCLMFS